MFLTCFIDYFYGENYTSCDHVLAVFFQFFAKHTVFFAIFYSVFVIMLFVICHCLVPGRLFDVQEYFLEDVLKW